MGFNTTFGMTCDSGKLGSSKIVHNLKDIFNNVGNETKQTALAV